MATQDIVEIIQNRIGTRTQSAFAKEIGVSESYLSDVLKNRRAPGPGFLDALGLKKIVTYAPYRLKRPQS